MATDALIGTFARTDDPSLMQNVCFLYHLIGGGTGDWDVPDRRHGCGHAVRWPRPRAGHGAEIVTGAEVYAIDPDGEVRYRSRRRGAPCPDASSYCPAYSGGAGRACWVSPGPRSRRAPRSRST